MRRPRTLPPGTNARDIPAAWGTHVCAGLEPRVRAPICGPGGGEWGRRTQVQLAPRARGGDLGASRTRGGTGSPARSRAATTRRAAPRRPWPDPALALLRATCRHLLRAARRLPRARPMGGRASLRGGAALYCWGEVRGSRPCRAQSPKSTRPSSSSSGPASYTWLSVAAEPPPRLSQDCAKGGESCWRRSLRSGRPGRSRRVPPLAGRVHSEPPAASFQASRVRGRAQAS